MHHVRKWSGRTVMMTITHTFDTLTVLQALSQALSIFTTTLEVCPMKSLISQMIQEREFTKGW